MTCQNINAKLEHKNFTVLCTVKGGIAYCTTVATELLLGPRGVRVTADRLVSALSGRIYLLSAFVGVEAMTMRGPDVAVNTSSAYNMFARKAYHLGRR